ncbi:MAG: glycosyltransferase [Candidatus Woesearchaeota archaeon]|jgi:cellulose synthase/poly-beta-1,6-N-acetylglucosamine synthase-like glycosyltransferase|nr:glycosyltransferase [Candidatus Woesearchaeota archaeon]
MESFIRALIMFAYLIALYFVVFWLLVLFEKKPEQNQKPLKQFPFVTILIPAYNEEKKITSTLKSILKLDYPKNKLDFIVVNDGSTDNTLQLIKDVIHENKEFKIRLINQKNHGKGAALNKGLKEAKGEFFICLDADSYVKEDSLKKLLPYFDKKDIACVLPVMKVRSPGNFLQKMQWFEYIVNMFYKELMGRLDCIHVTPGPFSIYRTSILKKVGCFDEDHNLTEDLEIALRLQSKNYKIIQALEGEVSTISPKTIKSLYDQRNRWYKGSILNAFKYGKMMFNKKYGDFGIIQMPVIIISGVIAVIIITALFYYNIWRPFGEFIKMRYIDFDFLTLIKTFTFDFHILDLDFTSISLAIIMLIISVFIFTKSHVVLKEKVNKHGILSSVIYLLSYFVLLGIIWIGILVELMIGKKQRW